MVQLTPMTPLAYKYAHVTLLTIIHPPMVYIMYVTTYAGHRNMRFPGRIFPWGDVFQSLPRCRRIINKRMLFPSSNGEITSLGPMRTCRAP